MSELSSCRPLLTWAFLQGPILSLVFAAGCTRSAAPGKMPVNYDRLRSLTSAYMQANQELGRAPANADDLQPYLKRHGDPTSLLRSEQDEEFVVLWGVDHVHQESKSNIIAYEKVSRNGQRYVGFTNYVLEMSEDQFRTLVFPGNHKPQ